MRHPVGSLRTPRPARLVQNDTRMQTTRTRFEHLLGHSPSSLPPLAGEAIQAAASPTSSTGSPQKGQMQTSTIPSHPSASPECEDGRTSRGLLLLPQDITTQKKLQAAADQQKKDRQHAISPRNTHRTDAPFASSAHQPTRTSPRGTSSSPSAGVRGMLQSGYKISDTKGGQHVALMLLEQKVEVQRDEIIKLKVCVCACTSMLCVCSSSHAGFTCICTFSPGNSTAAKCCAAGGTSNGPAGV